MKVDLNSYEIGIICDLIDKEKEFIKELRIENDPNLNAYNCMNLITMNNILAKFGIKSDERRYL